MEGQRGRSGSGIRRSLASALATAELRRLQVGWAASAVGGWMFFVALVVYAARGVCLRRGWGDRGRRGRADPDDPGWLGRAAGRSAGRRRSRRNVLLGAVGNGIANGTFMVAVNRIGDEPPLRFYGLSFISDPYGRVLVQAPRDRPAGAGGRPRPRSVPRLAGAVPVPEHRRPSQPGKRRWWRSARPLRHNSSQRPPACATPRIGCRTSVRSVEFRPVRMWHFHSFG